MHRPAVFANVVELSLPDARRAPAPCESGIDLRLSSEELVEVLRAAGATVLAVQEHGVLLGAERKLVFVHRRRAVETGELRDALRAVALEMDRFVELLAALRARVPRGAAVAPRT
jgi:hypothetical protein